MPHHYTNLNDLAATYDHIYLSPHLDDAALSCGGSIARFVASGQPVLVVTICAGSPPAESAFSPFAQQLHRQWDLPPAEAVRLRIQEDVEALEILGADCYLLDHLDAIYRMSDAYVDDATLFGTVAPDDPLAESLRERISALAAHYPTAIFYAPLGIGQHVDHQVAHDVAAEFVRSGLSMAFYEDVPYATVADALERRLAQVGGAEIFLPSVTDIDATLARKISAVESYRSQISTLFGDGERMARSVTAYAEGLRPESGRYGERIWMKR